MSLWNVTLPAARLLRRLLASLASRSWNAELWLYNAGFDTTNHSA